MDNIKSERVKISGGFPERISILGVPVDNVSPEEALERFVAVMERNDGCARIVTPNSEIVWRASKDDELRRLICEADIVIPDGIGLVYASRIIGKPLGGRVTGIDFLSSIARQLSLAGGSMFFLGSAPGVAEKASVNMAAAFPGMKVAGCHHGYFKEQDEPDVLAAINNSGADVLCVALGSPKQERFVRKYKDDLCVKAAIGVGGSLDVWSGNLKRAPAFFRNHGLEWLYRLIKEPRRIGRMAVLPLFILKVFFRGRRN